MATTYSYSETFNFINQDTEGKRAWRSLCEELYAIEERTGLNLDSMGDIGWQNAFDSDYGWFPFTRALTEEQYQRLIRSTIDVAFHFAEEQGADLNVLMGRKVY